MQNTRRLLPFLLFIYFFYYLCHHRTRFISGDSPLCLGIVFFNRRKTLRKVILSYYLFSSGILRIIKTFHSRPISCLTELLNCWWKLCIINFRWGSSSVLFQFSRLNLPWCTLVNYIVGFLAHSCWKQWLRYLGDVDGSCRPWTGVVFHGQKLHCRPWTEVVSHATPPHSVKVKKINFDEAQKLTWKKNKMFVWFKNNDNSNHISELLKMQLGSKSQNDHT